MNIFLSFFFGGGGVLGKRTLNPEVLKVSWRPHHTGYIYVQQGKTMDNKFYIYVKTLTSLAIWGGGGCLNNQTGPILVHIYPPFNNNLHVKYRSNLIRTFWVKINKRPIGLLAPPFKINFLATENLPKMKLKSVRILQKIIHLASGCHIW